MDNITDYPNNHEKKSKTDEIADRLRHKESGKLLQEPRYKRLHINHGAKHPLI